MTTRREPTGRPGPVEGFSTRPPVPSLSHLDLEALYDLDAERAEARGDAQAAAAAGIPDEHWHTVPLGERRIEAAHDASQQELVRRAGATRGAADRVASGADSRADALEEEVGTLATAHEATCTRRDRYAEAHPGRAGSRVWGAVLGLAVALVAPADAFLIHRFASTFNEADTFTWVMVGGILLVQIALTAVVGRGLKAHSTSTKPAAARRMDCGVRVVLPLVGLVVLSVGLVAMRAGQFDLDVQREAQLTALAGLPPTTAADGPTEATEPVGGSGLTELSLFGGVQLLFLVLGVAAGYAEHDPIRDERRALEREVDEARQVLDVATAERDQARDIAEAARASADAVEEAFGPVAGELRDLYRGVLATHRQELCTAIAAKGGPAAADRAQHVAELPFPELVAAGLDDLHELLLSGPLDLTVV